MAAQRAAGVTVPISPVITTTGLATLVLAPFGAFGLNLAAITAAICMGPEAQPDPKRRYVAPVAAGVFYLFTGLGGGSQVDCCLRHFTAVAASPTNSQTILADAPLLPGDSGGAIFNSDGELVGVISGGWFWWDGGVQTERGAPIHVTWPAKGCNVAPILSLRTTLPDWYTHPTQTVHVSATERR